jgi:hypothetical protein
MVDENRDVELPKPSPETTEQGTVVSMDPAYDEFEVGEHKVPWFLWVFFILIVAWASVSWIQFFGY